VVWRERARQPRERFRAAAGRALEDGHTQPALDAATARLRDARLAAWGLLPDVEELRERGREIKQRTIDDLDRYLDEFSRALEARGGHVHFAARLVRRRTRSATSAAAAGRGWSRSRSRWRARRSA
jgi:L-lactate utilization protein LutB